MRAELQPTARLERNGDAVVDRGRWDAPVSVVAYQWEVFEAGRWRPVTGAREARLRSSVRRGLAARCRIRAVSAVNGAEVITEPARP